MRLPWLQVDQDALTRCRLLARLLEVPDTQGIGIGLAAWAYALEIAPEGDFSGVVPDSGILAAAVGWSVTDAPRLITAFQRVGLVATEPNLRVRGLDRYKRAWEKNRRGGRKQAKSGDDVPEPGANPPGKAGNPAPQTQTQTQTHTERGSMSSALLAPRVVGAVEDTKKWGVEADQFLAWAKTQAPTLSDPGPKVRDWAHGFFLKHQPDKPELIRTAFAKFLVWCHQAGKQVGWGLWLADSVWEPRWAEVRAEAQARGAA